jgi:hypothetical protein
MPQKQVLESIQNWVGRPGLEPGTYGLKGLVGAEERRGVNPDRIPCGSFVARRVLELAASRDAEVVEAARALAEIVLASDELRLARRIVEGGPFVVVNAVELAERVLAVSLAALPDERTGAQ